MPFGKPRKEVTAQVDFGPVLEALHEGGVLDGAPRDDSPASMVTFVSSYHRAQELLDWRLLGCDKRTTSDAYRCVELPAFCLLGRAPDLCPYRLHQNEGAAGAALPDASSRVGFPSS